MGDSATAERTDSRGPEPGSASPPYRWCVVCGARPAEPFPKGRYRCRLHGGSRAELHIDPAKPKTMTAKPKPAPKPKPKPRPRKPKPPSRWEWRAWSVEEDAAVMSAPGVSAAGRFPRGGLEALAKRLGRTKDAVRIRRGGCCASGPRDPTSARARGRMMCERVDGELVVCAVARRRMARAAGPVQLPLIPFGLDSGGEHPWDSAYTEAMGRHTICRECGKDIYMLAEGTGPDQCLFCGCPDPASKTQPRTDPARETAQPDEAGHGSLPQDSD